MSVAMRSRSSGVKNFASAGDAGRKATHTPATIGRIPSTMKSHLQPASPPRPSIASTAAASGPPTTLATRVAACTHEYAAPTAVSCA